MAEENKELNTIELATELTIAWLNNPNNRVSSDEVPAFLQKMHSTINDLSSGTSGQEGASAPSESAYTPAVSVRKSLASKDHIVSMIDGKPYKTLRRHLSTHGLSPAEYRERYNLKPDYPMVAPNYSEHRRAMAHKIGLGSKGRKQPSRGASASAPAPAAQAAAAPAKPIRPPRKRKATPAKQ